MDFAVSANLSALRAFGRGMQVVANNVANVNSEEFKKSRVIMKEGLNHQVRTEVEQVDTPGPLAVAVEEGEIRERELSNVDLAEEITQAILIRRGYEANLVPFRTRDEMLGTIVDLVG